jgi:hypothetical protein
MRNGRSELKMYLLMRDKRLDIGIPLADCFEPHRVSHIILRAGPAK